MIAFLSPLYLLAGLAATVPLLLHLMRRRIGTRVEFPAVRYLLRAEREHSRRLRLRNLLLMLVRVAAVLTVTVAAARPVLRMRGSGHAPTALAIVLDNSLSTTAIVRGRPVLDGLRGEAALIAHRATEEDRLWLLTADGVVRGGSRGAVLAAIERVEPLAGAGSPERAARRAAEIVRQSATGALGAGEREVAIVTDGQATSWPEPVALDQVRVRAWVPPGAPPVNRGVVSVTPVPFRWTPRGTIRARLLSPDSATYRITLAGRTLARGTAARDEEVAVSVAPVERGWVGGTVETEPDEMRGDDVRHFAVWIGPPPAVATDPAVGGFVQHAIEALVQSGRVALGREVTIAPADAATRRPVLLVAPLDPVRIGAANRALERLDIPWRFGAVRRGESPARSARGPMLDGVSVTFRYELRPRRGVPLDTVATVAGEPWVVRGPGYVLVSSPLMPEATTLPVRAAFLPWLGEMVTGMSAAAQGPVVEAAPGDSVSVAAGADGLEGPTGGRTPVAGDRIAAPQRTGTYYYLRGAERVGALVVNPEPAESELARLDTTTLRTRLRGRDVVVTTGAATEIASVFASAPRRSVLLPLLGLALGLALMESALAGMGRRAER